MFDWDDQELANIIWCETSEADDHIVPYPEEIEKTDPPVYADNHRKKLIEEDTISKAAEQNISASEPFSDVGKRESNDGRSASGVIVDPELDLPSFATSKNDDDDKAKKDQLDIGPEISQNQHEDKELGELVGNSWANIGGFDDLDHIFSNDDLDGHTNLGSVDDLWPSSKDLINGAHKSSSQAFGSTSWEFGALANTSAHFEINSEYLQNENHSLTPGCQKADDSSSYSRRDVGRCVEREECALGTTGLVKEKTDLGITVKEELDSHLVSENVVTRNKSTNKEDWSRKKSNRVHRTDKSTDARLLRDTYESWPSYAVNVPQFDSQCTSATVQNYAASAPSQKWVAQDSSSMAYQHLSNPYVGPYGYVNGDVIYLNKLMETCGKPVNMTPQEKIEKLRRRQQMRAMLAIQKQKQQLGHKASSADDQVVLMEKTECDGDESLSTIPCYNPGSPNTRDDSSAISDIDDFSAEDTVLFQLQDVIARLDLDTRLCIRDSLYRLAQNAMRRSYASDTSSTNRTCTYESDVAKEEMSSNDRLSGKPNVETETNHIDRSVAHLLFHRPLKLSAKHAETPEPSTSTKVSIQPKTTTPSSLLVGFLYKSPENECNLSPHGSKTCHPFVEFRDEDTLNDIPQRETSINPQVDEKMEDQVD